MNRTPIHEIQAEEEREEVPVAGTVVTPLHRPASAETVILNLEEEQQAGEEQVVQESTESTEAETLAKESTGGSPRVPKQRKRKTSSESVL